MTTETISKATFMYYSEKSENALKEASRKIMSKGMKDDVDKYDMMRIVSFSSMNYGLKNELMASAFCDLDAFKVVVEKLIDHLVTEDPDIQYAIKGYHKIAKSQSK